MSNILSKLTTAAFLAALTLGAVAMLGCGGSEAAPTVTSGQSAAVTLPGDLFSRTSLSGASALTEARANAQPGEQITVTGVIGGRAAPFIEERAIFVLADADLAFCGDECPVPWDACCAPPEEIAAKTATVQVVDAAGMPLRTGLEGESGLSPLTPVTIRGTVAEGQGDSFVILAERIHVGTGTEG